MFALFHNRTTLDGIDGGYMHSNNAARDDHVGESGVLAICVQTALDQPNSGPKVSLYWLQLLIGRHGEL